MYDWFTVLGDFEVVPYDVLPHFVGADRVAAPRLVVRELHVVDWQDAPAVSRRGDVFLLPPRFALERLRGSGLARVLGTDAAAAAAVPSRRDSPRHLLWIRRATATTRRVVNEDELFETFRRILGALPDPPWVIDVFSDMPPAPTASDTVRLFHGADVVVGFHGSGQANQVFCRSGTGIIDINLPEPHSQYTAHNSYALGLPYRLVMMRGVALHQTVNVTVPVEDVEAALRSLLAAGTR